MKIERTYLYVRFCDASRGMEAKMIKIIDLSLVKWNNVADGGSVGMLPKTIIHRGNKRYYVKMSSYNIAQGVYGIESVSEVIASRLARLLKIPCVNYELYDANVVKDGKHIRTFVCISPDYKNDNETVVPFEDVYAQYRVNNEKALQFAKRIGISDSIYRMFIFDYIINNVDRHGANVEIYESTETIAPLFDNGSSLYATTDEDKIKLYYYGDDMKVNNFIGDRSLLSNLYEVDKQIKIGTLIRPFRKDLFKNLGAVISRDRRDTIWNHILRRYENARKICNFKEI